MTVRRAKQRTLPFAVKGSQVRIYQRRPAPMTMWSGFPPPTTGAVYRGSYVSVHVMVTDWFGCSTLGPAVHVTTEASGPLLV